MWISGSKPMWTRAIPLLWFPVGGNHKIGLVIFKRNDRWFWFIGKFEMEKTL